MIVRAYGVPGVTGIELAYIFQSLRLYFGIVRDYHFLKSERPRNFSIDSQPIIPVIIYGASTALRVQHKFKMSKVVAFIVDNPYSLAYTLKIPLLGAEILNKNGVVFSKIDKDLIEKILDLVLVETKNYKLQEGVVLKFHNHRPVEDILKKYEQSDLSSLQTLLYKIKNVETRSKVSVLTKNWLMTSVPFSKIESRLQTEIDKPAVIDGVKNLLTSSTVANLRLAIRQVNTNKLTLAKAAKKYKVSPFDLRFLFAVKNKQK